jgi:hypothetical protein
MAFPYDGVRFQPGNPGKPVGAAPVSRRRARKLVATAIIAEAAGPHVPDFDGDALGYLQACYTGRIKPDPLRLSAAVAATRFEKPALNAIAVQTVVRRPQPPFDPEKLPPHLRSALEEIMLWCDAQHRSRASQESD